MATPATRERTDLVASWRPQPGPQKALIDCPVPEILFGGARGGGKTDGFLGKWGLKALRYGTGFNAVFFRQEMPQQDDLIDRAKEIYGPVGGKWQQQKHLFLMPRGGRIRFRPLESIVDAMKYQGQNLSDAAVEEAGNYADPAPIDRLFGCLRSRAAVPVQMLMSANPGGPGHHWIKDRFIDPAPLGMKILKRYAQDGRELKHTAVYIPSKVQDNRILLAHDPGYIDRLYLVGSATLVKAWLEGDWSVIEGAYFPEFGPKHIVKPFAIPKHWTRIRAMDWGSARPFCVLWIAVSDGELVNVPRGALVVYREWYGWNGKPNTGCKLTAEKVGEGIQQLEALDAAEGITPSDSVLDPAAFARDGGPSIAERMNLGFRGADNSRVAKHGAMGGWDQVRDRLVGEDDKPQLYVFSNCTHLIRTLPALQHDAKRAEDVDTDSEDHAADTLRYGCMSRPYTRLAPNMPAPRFDTQLTINEIIKRHQRRYQES